MTQVNVDTIIAGIVKLRDKKSAIKAEFDKAYAELTSKQDALETGLLQIMQAQGATQLGSSHGTAYKQIKLKASATDWSVVHEYMVVNKRMDLVEKRLSITAVKDILDTTGEYPPGINVHQEYTVVVRRS